MIQCVVRDWQARKTVKLPSTESRQEIRSAPDWSTRRVRQLQGRRHGSTLTRAQVRACRKPYSKKNGSARQGSILTPTPPRCA